MASVGTHKVPRENKDEDKWFRFFTKIQLLGIAVGLLVGYIIVRFFQKFGLTVVGVFIALVNLIVIGVVMMFSIPPSKYLLGSGNPIYVILMRLLAHKMKHKNIYVRNYGEEERQEDAFDKLFSSLINLKGE